VLIISGCASKPPDRGDVNSSIVKAITGESKSQREDALVNLLGSGKEIPMSQVSDLFRCLHTTNECDCVESRYDACGFNVDRFPTIVQIDLVHYILFSNEPPPTWRICLLTKIRYPEEEMRFAVLSLEYLSFMTSEDGGQNYISESMRRIGRDGQQTTVDGKRCELLIGSDYATPDITKAITTESQSHREKALFNLLRSAKEIEKQTNSEPWYLLKQALNTNCPCAVSGYDASELNTYQDGRLFQIDTLHFLHFGYSKTKSEYYLTLLIKIRYPSQQMRFAILAQQNVSRHVDKVFNTTQRLKVHKD
jgi:hypothetical protein